jgi:hypothetical protein
MIAAALLLAAGLGAPHKLIVVANDSTVAIDYPTRERCAQAAQAAEAEARRRWREAQAASGDPIVRPSLRVMAFCIPG